MNVLLTYLLTYLDLLWHDVGLAYIDNVHANTVSTSAVICNWIKKWCNKITVIITLAQHLGLFYFSASESKMKLLLKAHIAASICILLHMCGRFTQSLFRTAQWTGVMQVQRQVNNARAPSVWSRRMEESVPSEDVQVDTIRRCLGLKSDVDRARPRDDSVSTQLNSPCSYGCRFIKPLNPRL